MQTPSVTRVLAAINRCAPVSVDDSNSPGEWFYLESATLEDLDLYTKLKTHWVSIVGPNKLAFALIFCEDGDDAGVWLHYLDSHIRVEYAFGCHRIDSWF